jgi:hypothetical protein
MYALTPFDKKRGAASEASSDIKNRQLPRSRSAFSSRPRGQCSRTVRYPRPGAPCSDSGTCATFPKGLGRQRTPSELRPRRCLVATACAHCAILKACFTGPAVGPPRSLKPRSKPPRRTSRKCCPPRPTSTRPRISLCCHAGGKWPTPRLCRSPPDHAGWRRTTTRSSRRGRCCSHEASRAGSGAGARGRGAGGPPTPWACCRRRPCGTAHKRTAHCHVRALPGRLSDLRVP